MGAPDLYATKKEQLAVQIIDLAKAEILSRNHFLANALGKLANDPVSMRDEDPEMPEGGDFDSFDDVTTTQVAITGRSQHAGGAAKQARRGAQFTTNGEQLGFHPDEVLSAFRRAGGKAPTHDLAHTLVHCMFLHPFVNRNIDSRLWDLACDIAAERVVGELLGPREEPRGSQILSALKVIENDLGQRATAELIFRMLKEGRYAGMIPFWELTFYSDNHMPWYAPADLHTGMGDPERGEKGLYDDPADQRGPEPGGDERRASKSKPEDAEPHEGEGDGTDGDANVKGDNTQTAPADNDASTPPASDGDEQNDSAGQAGQATPTEPPNSDDTPQRAPDGNPPSSSAASGGSGADSSATNGSMGASNRPSEHASPEHADMRTHNPCATDPGDLSSESEASARAQGHGIGRGKGAYASDRAGLDIIQHANPNAGVGGLGSRFGDGPKDEPADGPAREPNHALARLSERQREELADEWRETSTSLSIDLQTYAREKASALSGFQGDLDAAAAKPVDYRQFLRQFATIGEVMGLSDNEFDLVFYTYGMRLYGNLPLIEPVETHEEHRIREFVIVIDTSGSVRGNIVRAFVDTTFDVLKTTESFHRKVHIRIIQCDEVVQSDNRIDSLDELQSWRRSMRLFGGGGTDFRPAFRYVDKLVEDGEFEDLGGLIYFTDGWGTYPEWRPRYNTAFVFFDDNHRARSVPPWAITATLQSEGIDPDAATSSFGATAADAAAAAQTDIRERRHA